MGINRNIVECKVGRHNPDWRRNTVLIETLWNVKGERHYMHLVGGPEVLIETLWNVKYDENFKL